MIDFLKVEQLVKTLKSQVDAGELEQHEFEAHLLGMIDVAGDGYYWMFGHKTGHWYRHNGKAWVAEDPGELLVSITAGDDNPFNGTAGSPPPDWDSIDIGWFFVSLVLMGVIGSIVYVSAL